MTDEVQYVPCGVSRCKWKKDFEDLAPKYEQMKGSFTDKANELTQFKEIIAEGKTTADDRVKEILVKKVDFENHNNMLNNEVKRLKRDLLLVNSELEQKDTLLRKKTEEVYEIKTKYELDEEIIERSKQLAIEKDHHSKLVLENNKLRKIHEKVDEKFKRMEDDYRRIVNEHNLYVDKIMKARKTLKSLEKEIPQKKTKLQFLRLKKKVFGK